MVNSPLPGREGEQDQDSGSLYILDTTQINPRNATPFEALIWRHREDEHFTDQKTLHYDALPRLGELAGLPALVVSAAHDPIAPPAVGRALAAGIPGSRHVEVSDASHGLPIQHAERVNALLLEHLARVDEAAGRPA